MATTAKGTPYVESSDLVANYPAVSLALAEHIDDIGKVLQVVRATDTTQRTTTSTSFVDVTGMSVTITPQRSTSVIIIIANFAAEASTNNYILCRITDSSNNAISGAEQPGIGDLNSNSIFATLTPIGYATPATTSPITYKLRFAINTAGTAKIQNAITTGQMYAIEVSA